MSCLLAVLLVLALPAALSGCTTPVKSVKIGVLREDEGSGLAAAWKDYLLSLAGEYGFNLHFTTTDSAESEISAIKAYASEGYHAVLLFSNDDIEGSVKAAAAKGMYTVCAAQHPSEEQQKEIEGLEYYLGSIGPTPDTEYEAGYEMARYFAEGKEQTAFTLYGGSASSGDRAQLERLAGMLAYFCENGSAAYDGAATRQELLQKLSGSSFDPARFTSTQYRITGYLGGTAMDDAFAASLSESIRGGGTCVLAVSSGDSLVGLISSLDLPENLSNSVLVGGVDAIVREYAPCFDLGYAYDCGLFPSSVGPAVAAVLCAVHGDKILDEKGFAPVIDMAYWRAAGRESLSRMLASDNAADGYCYNRAVLEHILEESSCAELQKLCAASYPGAVAIHQKYNGPDSAVSGKD